MVVVGLRKAPWNFSRYIAGICSIGRNVVGLMPHLERACHALLGGTDGEGLLRSLLLAARARVPSSL